MINKALMGGLGLIILKIIKINLLVAAMSIFKEIAPRLGSYTRPSNYKEKIHIIIKASLYVFTVGHDMT